MIHPTAKVAEEVKRKLHARNKVVQLLALYTEPARHNVQCYTQTDGRTKETMMQIANHTL